MTKKDKQPILTPEVTENAKKRYNLGSYQGTYTEDEDRKISKAGLVLYGVEQVKQVLKAGKLSLATRKCKNNFASLGFDLTDGLQLIEDALDSGIHKGGEWCEVENGNVLACDAYTVRRKEFNKALNKYVPVEYYIKFAISKTGALLLLVSCHL